MGTRGNGNLAVPGRRDESGLFSRSPVRLLSGLARGLLVGLVHLYRWTVGALLPDACRFTPTCSRYFIEAVEKHGALRGAYLGVRRLLRCHPYCKGGHDPVP